MPNSISIYTFNILTHLLAYLFYNLKIWIIK